MKHQIRLVIVLIIGLILIIGVVGSLQVTAKSSTVSPENRKAIVPEVTTDLRMTTVFSAVNANVIAINGTYAYIGADARLLVFDIADPTNPQFITETTLTQYNIEHISIADNYAYVANGDGGVRVVSLANPALPVEVGHTDSITSVVSIAVAGNYAYAAGIDFHVLAVSNPANPHSVGAIGYRPADHIVVQGEYAYTIGVNQFGIITITNPLLPEVAGFTYEVLTSYDFEIAGDYAYLATYNDGLVIVSIVTPTQPYLMGSVFTSGYAQVIAVSDGIAYVCSQNYSSDGTGYMEKISITNPNTPVVVKTLRLLTECNDIVVRDGHLYIVTNDGLSVFASDTLRKVGEYPPSYRVYLPTLFTNYGKCMSSPTLLTPTHGAQLDTLIPVFWWDNGSYPNADRIRLDISTDSQMAVLYTWLTASANPGSRSFRFSTNFLPETTYYWRMHFTCDGGSQGPYSDVWSFTLGSEGILLPPPTLKAPADRTTLTTTVVTLEWNPVPGAIEYVVAHRPVGVTWYNYQTITDTQHEINYLQSAITYEWWVRVGNDHGYSDDSDKWQFTTPASAGVTTSPALQDIQVLEEDGVIRVVED